MASLHRRGIGLITFYRFRAIRAGCRPADFSSDAVAFDRKRARKTFLDRAAPSGGIVRASNSRKTIVIRIDRLKRALRTCD